MDKIQFFESLIVPLQNSSGQELQASGKIASVLTAIRSDLTNPKLRSEFELLEKEILFRVWMFEQICNSQEIAQEDGSKKIFGPLIVIVLARDVLFVNKAYCALSGLNAGEIRDMIKNGTLYDNIYEGENLVGVKEAVSRLQAGKGYKQLELTMRHSGEKIAWNSYGGVGEYLEIRSGRILTEENNQNKERELYYRGSLMDTTRLIDNMYQVCVHEMLSEENEIQLIWIQEFLSMFDFLWNHGEFLMETIQMPTTKKDKIRGLYNTVYAQFFGSSFKEEKTFKNILTTSYGMDIPSFVKTKMSTSVPTIQELHFYEKNKYHRADVHWQSCMYPYETSHGYTNIFSFGTIVRSIHRKNIFIRIFQYIFRKK